MRKKQVCPCLNIYTAPTCSCVFVCVVLSNIYIYIYTLLYYNTSPCTKLVETQKEWGAVHRWVEGFELFPPRVLTSSCDGYFASRLRPGAVIKKFRIN